MSSKESAIEKTICKYAEERGAAVIKMSPMGSSGWPDRLIFFPFPKHAFIEFKRKGGTPRKLQQHRINTLLMLGWKVYLVDNVVEGKVIVDSLVA